MTFWKCTACEFKTSKNVPLRCTAERRQHIRQCHPELAAKWITCRKACVEDVTDHDTPAWTCPLCPMGIATDNPSSNTGLRARMRHAAKAHPDADPALFYISRERVRTLAQQARVLVRLPVFPVLHLRVAGDGRADLLTTDSVGSEMALQIFWCGI